MTIRTVIAALALLMVMGVPTAAQEDLREPRLINAAGDGQVAAVARILDSGFDVNTRMGKRQYTALMYAAEFGQTDMVRFLLERGADPRLVDYAGSTARAVATRKEHRQIIILLAASEGSRGAMSPAASGAPGDVAPARAAAVPAAPVSTPPGVAPRDGRWRGTLHGITRGGTQSVEFVVRGGRIMSSTFDVDYHCAPQYVYRQRMRLGFATPIAVVQGRFAAERREPGVSLETAGRFPTAITAQGTFKMEDTSRCTTRLVTWQARFVGR